MNLDEHIENALAGEPCKNVDPAVLVAAAILELARAVDRLGFNGAASEGAQGIGEAIVMALRDR